MEPSASKPKHSFRKFLSKTADKLLRRSPSSGSSQQPSREPSVRSAVGHHASGSSSSPLPRNDNLTPVSAIVQLSAEAPSGLPAAHLVPASSPSEPPSIVGSPAMVDLPPMIECPSVLDSLPVVESPPVIEPPPAIEFLPTAQLLQPVEYPVATTNPRVNDIPAIPAVPTSSQTTRPTLPESRKAITGVWKGLDTALRALGTATSLFPPVQSAISVFLPCLDIIQAIGTQEASQNSQEYKELTTELISLIETLTQHLSPSTPARMSDSITKISRGIEEQCKLLDSKRDREIGSRLLEADADVDEIARCYRQIQSLFRQLQIDASLSMWDLINDQMTDTRLAKLTPVTLANYDSKLSTGISRRTCTEGTRTAILAGLNEWSCDPEAAGLYWMNGMAGTGKTTITCTFAESLDEQKQLAASFFCTRTVPECRDVNRIIPTIAYQLAQYSIPYQSELCQVLASDPNIGAKNVVKQFERLLRGPLLKVKEAIPSSLVVAIDALDECDDMVEVELLLSVLLRSASDLPLRFFVTSRPEPGVYSRMLARDQGQRTVMHLHEVEKSLVQADIELYLSAELECLSTTPSQVKELARRSGTLFIYAATLVRYIRSPKSQADPERRLQDVLSMSLGSNKQYATIDSLYAAVLKTALEDEELTGEEAENVRQVLHTAICLQEPVSIEVLAALVGVKKENRVLAVLQTLGAVLHYSETTGLVSTLHSSFPDFLLDESRSGSLCCKPATQSGQVAQRCFGAMKSQLRFNICNIGSSFVADRSIKDLDERVKKAISPTLWYACRYWGHHLKTASFSNTLCLLLTEFLSKQLLFWIEVLTLKCEGGKGADILLRAKHWLQSGEVPGDAVRLAEDARNFTTSFAANPVSQSTPHIYMSALAFCAKSSTVFKGYWGRTRGLMAVAGSVMGKREAAALAEWKTDSIVQAVSYSTDGGCIVFAGGDKAITIRNAHDGTLFVGPLNGHTSSVKSVAYSPDGSRIASGSLDKTIRVWNAHDGTLIVGPLKGHTDSVKSVAYSPGGTRIVSSSYDKTIRVWNAHDGTLAVGPLEGHTSSVNSVAYSPDGTRIVSGSSDNTVRVWDAHDGRLVVGPLQGHTSSVRSVAYSPDGTRIISGSLDGTIRVWNAHDGTLVVGPLQGHTSSVRSVAYSPDGTRIVSGSYDKTIRVWNAHDGTLVVGPLKGHTKSVNSVAYSPDGTRIVSGSSDNTVRVWNAHDGTLDVGSFKGHTKSVNSVAYSPDGTRTVSGSSDKTIRVWNTLNDTLDVGPLTDHTSSVEWVAYSPDGTRIVSGSSDETIRVWDAHDGTLVVGPLKGHTSSVRSVAYSPDGTRIVSSSYDKTIRVWNAHDGTLAVGPLQGHTSSVYSVAYSPDGTRIVSGSSDNTVRVWDAHDGRLVVGPLQGHTSSVRSVAYSPDGTRIISGSSDNTVRVWHARDGRPVVGPLQGHTSSVESVAYSPDGTRIVSGSADETIRVWDAHDGTLVVGPLQGHTSSVNSVAYSPDGTRVLSGSHDSTIRVWNVSQRASPDVSSSTPLERRYSTTEDGWVVDANHNLLFWVPPELRFAFTASSFDCVSVIGENGSLAIDYGDMLFGQHWNQCFMLD